MVIRNRDPSKMHDSPEHGALWINVTADAEQRILAATIAAKLAA
jgi:hypothetical protein